MKRGVRVLKAVYRTLKGLAPRQVGALVVLAVISFGVLAFIELADEVMEAETQRFDEAILVWFREADAPGELVGPEWLEKAVRDLTSLGGGPVIALFTAIAAGFFLVDRKYGLLFLLLATVVGGALMSVLLKTFFERARPEFVPALMLETTFSFPSGHSTGAALIYPTIGVMLATGVRQLRVKVYVVVASLIIAILVGITRVMLGVHYPTDVLAGWSLGIVWASVCWLAAIAFVERANLFRIGRKEFVDALEDEKREDAVVENGNGENVAGRETDRGKDRR